MSETLVVSPFTRTEPAADTHAGSRLSDFAKGERGIIVRVRGETDPDIERRLLELGFIEGAEIEVLHEGTFGRDPIAVRLGNMRLALRRREASNVLVRRSGK